MPAPAQLHDLVNRFREQLPDYKGGRYNETQLRRDFLDPLFRLLGWDMDNRAGYAETFREVVHEDAVKVGGTTKAPDYSFRLGGRRLFFLEAKKPSVFIKEDIAPAYQLRRYAWSAGLQLSILSDFEVVAQTLGRQLAGKSPWQAEKQRICDPACGSGSFLIGAYSSSRTSARRRASPWTPAASTWPIPPTAWARTTAICWAFSTAACAGSPSAISASPSGCGRGNTVTG
jgi:hypothetical protein